MSERKRKRSDEKRLRTYRPAPSKDTLMRIDRALTQRLYLVDRQEEAGGAPKQTFAVFGSTGNIYKVEISQQVSCTCPDHGKGNLCKHILFIFLRVLRVRRSNPVIWQAALLTTELQEIFASAPAVLPRTAPLAADAVRLRYAQVSGVPLDSSLAAQEAAGGSTGAVQRKNIEGPCPICFEDMHDPLERALGKAKDGAPEEIVWCTTTCGQNVHGACFVQWAKYSKEAATCPYCRCKWEGVGKPGRAGSSTSHVDPSGYLNLGDLQPGTHTDDEFSGGGWRGGGWRGTW
jgi:hypothetical protein